MANRLMTPAFVTDCAIIDTGTTIHMKAGVSRMPAVMHIKTLCFVDIDCNAIQNPRAEHPYLSSPRNLRARLARYGYQYLSQYPNTSFRILRKTRLGNFRILNNEYWYSDTEYSSHINSWISKLTSRGEFGYSEIYMGRILGI